MPTYKFEISGLKPFIDPEVVLASQDAAWDEAVRLVRDIEGTLDPGGVWAVEISEEGRPIFRIMVVSEDLRGASREATPG